VSEITGVDLRTGQEEPSQDEGDVVAHQLGSALGDRVRDLAPDAVIEKPIDPSRRDDDSGFHAARQAHRRGCGRRQL